MHKRSIEITVGIFMLLGILCLAYMSIRFGKMEVFSKKGYDVYGLFADVGGLRIGASVSIAGVEVGRVKSISLNEQYEARVVLSLNAGIQLQEDSIASVKTKGLIGEKYVGITPGGAEEIIKPEGRIRETESAVDLESMISKYAFGDV